MAAGLDFNVEAIEPVHLDARPPLSEWNWMSPYVWDEGDGTLRMMVRAVPQTLSETGNTGSIYYGESHDSASRWTPTR